jgi:antitoxin (DNA-binding transcriptional repressor) of toxin-antitoxin stability system
VTAAKRKRPEPLVVETPFPDPTMTAQRLGMTREEVAYVGELVAAAAHKERRPPTALAYLHRLIKRVEKGEAVPLALPGLPLLVLVPVDDHALIEAFQKSQKRVGPKRRGPQLRMTVEELAQWVEAWLAWMARAKRSPGRARSGSSTTSKEGP